MMARIRFILCMMMSYLMLTAGVAQAGQVGGLADARIDGDTTGVRLLPNQPFNFCARPRDFYAYSGSRDEIYGVPLAIAEDGAGAPKLRGTVGANGRNNADDVKLVQSALRALELLAGPADGVTADATAQAIKAYQVQTGISQPNGRIEPGGRAAESLLASARHYLLRLGTTSRYGGPSTPDDAPPETRPDADNAAERAPLRRPAEASDDVGGSYRCAKMVAPGVPGKFQIKYSADPIFVRSGEAATPARIAKLVKDRAPRVAVLRFEVRTDAPYGVRPFAVYMRVNGDIPATGGRANPKGGFAPQPIIFSWYTKEKETSPPDTFAGVEFRYRLSPVETTWGPWGSAKSVPYYFIMPGRHSFEVEARYRGQDGDWRTGGFALFDFTLSTAFVSAPAVVAKGDAAESKGFTPVQRVALEKIYPASRAFLAGVQRYEDPQLAPLPYVDRDLEGVRKALADLKFDVGHAFLNTTRAELMAGLESFVKTVNEGDRVIMYFSMHGFQDQQAQSRAYVAPKDCRWEAPGVYCVPLSILSEYVLRLNRRGARHVVVVLDTCSAGLGILEKSTSSKFYEMKMAEAAGAHMITAGLADQKALMDNDKLKMSYFTHFLIEGLSGKADLTGDGVTSLSELLVYVRGEVARISNGEQTPMMGRLNGSGEMVFVVDAR